MTVLRRENTGQVLLKLQPAETVVAGTLVTVNASESILACVNSIIQFRFFRDGLPVQGWSGSPSYQEAASADAIYRVEVRCAPASVDDPVLFDQESQPVGASEIALFVYSGDVGELPQERLVYRRSRP